MDPVSIEYRITLNEDKVETFKFKLNGKNFDLITDEVLDPPPWTELSFRQCSHCPLNAIEHSHCPLALQLNDIVERFHNTRSIDQVKLEVITEERRVIQTLPVQRAIASVLGLISPICGCPKTAYMKPMARFHLPLASEEETVFRVTGMYLLAQYFLSQTAIKSDIEFAGLTKIYDDLHIVNAAIASRLQGATRSDSLKNAIALLDMYSILVPMLLEDQLMEMRGFFGAYLPEVGDEVATANHLEKAKEYILELVPMDDSVSDDGRPAWLREVGAASNSESTASKEATEAIEKNRDPADEFLHDDDLKLKLEPISDQQEEDTQHPMSWDTPGQSNSRKAVFKLPDD